VDAAENRPMAMRKEIIMENVLRYSKYTFLASNKICGKYTFIEAIKYLILINIRQSEFCL
jgi:hypothetical protein